MKFPKKPFIVGAVVLSLALLVGCGPPRHRRFHGRDFSKHILKRLDSRIEKLDLSEAQKKKYEEIRPKIEATLAKAREGREKLFRELRGEMDRENPDLHRAVSLVKLQLEEMPASVGENLNLFMEFYDVLDEDQKAQVVKQIRKRIRKR